jgi:hypothetical protein
MPIACQFPLLFVDFFWVDKGSDTASILWFSTRHLLYPNVALAFGIDSAINTYKLLVSMTRQEASDTASDSVNCSRVLLRSASR